LGIKIDMNNTRTKTLAMFAVLIAATLVVGAGTFTTITQSAYAYKKTMEKVMATTTQLPSRNANN
jgi:hypothetical protein